MTPTLFMNRIIQICLLGLVLIPLSNTFSQVWVGAEILLRDEIHLIADKRIGVIANHSSRLPDGRHLVDALQARKDVKLVALFSPEHGFGGTVPAGEEIRSARDAALDIPVYSLYGQTTKPTPEMLKGIDVLLFDIQDVGVRFFTYISTMSYAMEAAAEMGIPFVVLDRPNPITGTRIGGFIVHDTLKSFVGLHPIPIMHGMTVGELAMMFNNEGWLRNGVKAELRVVKMKGWERDHWFDQTGLVWVKPSPNIVTTATATVYPATCYFEGTNISEGRGTDQPFETVGAPFLNGHMWAAALRKSGLAGIRFHPVTFVPRDIENVVTNPKYRGETCNGVRLEVVDRNAFDPIRTALVMLRTAIDQGGDRFKWRERSIDRLMGTSDVRMRLAGEAGVKNLEMQARHDTDRFKPLRKKYLLYE